jgi:TRAP-type C4-dicarboxylate transport system substrate-binding protein
LITGIGRSLFEVVKHVTLSSFTVDTSILAINRKTWERLPKDLQAIISEAAAKRDQEQFERVKAFIDEALAKYLDRGVKVHRLDAAAVADLRKATQPAIDEWVKAVPGGQKYLDLVAQTKSK